MNVQQMTKTQLLLHFLKGSSLFFIVSVAASFLVNLCAVILPQIISFVIDSVLGSVSAEGFTLSIANLFGGVEYIRSNIWLIAPVLAVIASLTALFKFIDTYFNAKANQTMMQRMRSELFSHIQRLPMSWQSQHPTGDTIQRCTSDLTTISNFVASQMATFLQMVAIITFSLIFMFLMHTTLAIIATAFIPVQVAVSVIYFKHTHKKFRECDENEGILSAYAQENLTGVRVVRAFGRERYERDKFEKHNRYYTGLWIRVGKTMSLFWSGSEMWSFLQAIAIISCGTVFCVQGSLHIGQLVAFISYNTLLMGPVEQIGRVIANMSRVGVALGRIGEIMTSQQEELGEDEQLSGDIEFKDVSFDYGDGKPVLKNVSFTVHEGESLGILGSTGSGKSTVIALLLRLYPVSDGGIYIGGRNINDIALTALRRHIGAVLQEGYLYSGTIAENIAMATSSANMEQIEAAARSACIDESVKNFSQGYETVVGERGVTLSGGQKQRVSIARTLLRKTPVVAFDDSLSAVDAETDAEIRKNLALLKGRTVITVSHRVATIMHSDNIIVMNGGEISESGTHDELMEKDGDYKRIYRLQTDLLEAENE